MSDKARPVIPKKINILLLENISDLAIQNLESHRLGKENNRRLA